MKDKMLALGVILCLLLIISSVYSLMHSVMPPFDVGECVEVNTGDGAIARVKILENDLVDRSSKVEGVVTSELNFGYGFFYSTFEIKGSAGFAELREASAKAIDCELL